jgi:hypothetical protein
MLVQQLRQHVARADGIAAEVEAFARAHHVFDESFRGPISDDVAAVA